MQVKAPPVPPAPGQPPADHAYGQAPPHPPSAPSARPDTTADIATNHGAVEAGAHALATNAGVQYLGPQPADAPVDYDAVQAA